MSRLLDRAFPSTLPNSTVSARTPKQAIQSFSREEGQSAAEFCAIRRSISVTKEIMHVLSVHQYHQRPQGNAQLPSVGGVRRTGQRQRRCRVREALETRRRQPRSVLGGAGGVVALVQEMGQGPRMERSL